MFKVQIHVFYLYFKNKERALQIKKELDLEGFQYSAGMYAVLMELATSTKDFSLAVQYKNQM